MPAAVAGVAVAVVVGVLREVAVVVGDEVDVVQVAVGVAVGVRVADRREREGADDEQVVVVVALEPQLGLVRVDDELVVAGAAGGDERRVGAGAQPAARRRDQATGRCPAASSAPSRVAGQSRRPSRFVPKIWPIWNMSLPAPPSRVMIAVVSST